MGDFSVVPPLNLLSMEDRLLIDSLLLNKHIQCANLQQFNNVSYFIRVNE